MADAIIKHENAGLQCDAPECHRGVRNKGLCGKHYQRFRTYGCYEIPPKSKPDWATCSLDGCVTPARSRQARYCEVHYYRMRRNGNFDAPVFGQWAETEHGYVMKRDLEHPISSKTGYLYQHRAVLFDHIGGGLHQCHWCGDEVEWGATGARKLVVDHLNGVKTDNREDNLVPSCHRCNSTRGLFQSWVQSHRNDPFLLAMLTPCHSSDKQRQERHSD